MDTTGSLDQDECAAATNWDQTSSRRLGDGAGISDLRSFAIRIERLKDEQDAIAEDIRGI